MFRVRKDDEKDVGKQHAVDAATVSAALRAKQEKAARAEMRRLVRQKKREEATREALNEEEMKHKKLSVDQVSLYHMVQRQIKRELRKVRKEFLTSAARRDIMQLSETSLQAMKQELISFMAEHPPGNVAVRSISISFSCFLYCCSLQSYVICRSRSRTQKMLECAQRSRRTSSESKGRPASSVLRASAVADVFWSGCSLEDEEKQWLEMKATLEADRSSALSEATNDGSSAVQETSADPTEEEDKTGDNHQPEMLPCELKVTQSVEALQRSALQHLGSTTDQVHDGVAQLNLLSRSHERSTDARLLILLQPRCFMRS